MSAVANRSSKPSLLGSIAAAWMARDELNTELSCFIDADNAAITAEESTEKQHFK